MNTGLVSIVVPCYNIEKYIERCINSIINQTYKNLEIIAVNDGSKDNTLKEIKELRKKDPEHVHFVSFSRNFGKESALYAGLQAATGDYVVVMDVDLQDPPKFLPQMYDLIKTGEYDCIGTRRVDRTGEAKFKSFLSDMFYNCLLYTSPSPRDCS